MIFRTHSATPSGLVDYWIFISRGVALLNPELMSLIPLGSEDFTTPPSVRIAGLTNVSHW